MEIAVRDLQEAFAAVNPNVVLPLASSLLSFAFATLVGDQWLRRRQPYQLVWTVGLLWYGISYFPSLQMNLCRLGDFKSFGRSQHRGRSQ